MCCNAIHVRGYITFLVCCMSFTIAVSGIRQLSICVPGFSKFEWNSSLILREDFIISIDQYAYLDLVDVFYGISRHFNWFFKFVFASKLVVFIISNFVRVQLLPFSDGSLSKSVLLTLTLFHCNYRLLFSTVFFFHFFRRNYFCLSLHRTYHCCSTSPVSWC